MASGCPILMFPSLTVKCCTGKHFGSNSVLPFIAAQTSRLLEKLVYLRQSLKDGSAKTVIEGLSHSGDQYEEAIAMIALV